MLAELYSSTGGAGWTGGLNAHWLQGEPCVDGWFGVICCPDSHPDYRPAGGGAWACFPDDADGAGGVAAFSWQEGGNASTYPRGCHSGNSTGTKEDRARCVVVGLSLGGGAAGGGDGVK